MYKIMNDSELNGIVINNAMPESKYIDSGEDNFLVYKLLRAKDGSVIYIGKGKGRRPETHQYRALKGKHYNKFLERVIQKDQSNGLGLPKIIIVQEKLTESEAFYLEIELIKEIGRRDLGLGPLLNMTDGGEGGSGAKRTEETKRLMGLAQLGNRRGEGRKGQHHTPETKEKIRIRMLNRTVNPRLGTKHSEETKNKLREKQLGRKHTPEHIEKVRQSKIGNTNWLGKSKSEESKEKCRLSMIEAHRRNPRPPMTDEQKKKISEGRFRYLERKKGDNQIANG